MLTGYNRVIYHYRRCTVSAVLDSADSRIGRQHFHLPFIVIRDTIPYQINLIRIHYRLVEIVSLDTRRIFQLDVVNEHITIHHQSTQTGRESDIIISQITIRENITHFLKCRSAYLNGIKRHERIGIIDISH